MTDYPPSTLRNRFAMLVASVLKKLLWTLRYPSFAPESGPYRVGAIQTRIPGSIQCQILYPTTTTSEKKSSSFHPYFRPDAVQGLADYSRTSPDLLEILSNRNHPCVINADPNDEKSFPLVVFSHGLGGCMEMYTQLCQQIASHGYCVVAMEHEDGSGAYAETEKGDPIYYKRPDDSPYSRQKVINFRRPFLEQRVEETTEVLDYIYKYSLHKTTKKSIDESDGENSNLLDKVLQSVDMSDGVALAGHSFGGATMVLAAQKYLSEQQQQQQSQGSSGKTTTIQPNSLTVLDPWAFSLEDEALDRGIDEIPTLSVLSEAWLTNPETAQVDRLLQHCPTAVSLYAPHSVHASVSDSVSWLPGFILRRLGLRGAEEKKFETFLAAAKVCVEQLRTGKVTDIGSLKEYEVERVIQPSPVKEVVAASP